MKTAHKLILAVLVTALLTIPMASAYTEDAPLPEDEGLRPPRRMIELSEEKIDEIMQGLTETSPQIAERLEKLREEDPDAFQMQIRRIAMKSSHRGRRGERMQPPEGRGGGKYGGRRSETRDGGRGRDMMRQRETEILEWLEENDPNQAQELKTLKGENHRLYIKKMSSVIRKYNKVIDAEKTNPALAAVLKEDVELKSQTRALMKKIKAATDEDEKQELKTELESLTGKRFDLIIKKKQLRYEDLKKKLEELKNNIKESEAELENLKGKKSEQIKERVEELISKTEKIQWE